MGFEPFKSKARLFRKPRHCFPSKENPDVFPKHSQPRRFSGAPVLEAAWLSSCSKAGLSTSGAGTCPWALGSASTWVHGLKKKCKPLTGSRCRTARGLSALARVPGSRGAAACPGTRLPTSGRA